jgi:hypothetical protein
LNSRSAGKLVAAGHARRPRLGEVAFHSSLLPSEKQNRRVEGFQADYITSTAGCISN